jgi:anti-sigma factor (TIGR02949 family)
MRCEEVLEQLWEYLDDEARAELSARINEHLGECHDCRAEVDTLRMTVSLYRCEESAPVPIQLNERLRAALDAAYRESGKSRD